MKNAMKKGILLLVLTVLVASGAFAQRVGDTTQLGGQTYRVESVSDGRVVLQLVPSLDGVWVGANGSVITINGSTNAYNQFSSTGYVQDAVNKGFIKVGDPAFRNLTSTGALTWTGQGRLYNFNNSAPNVCTGVSWTNITITMNANGQTFQTFLSGASVNATGTYTRRQ